MSLTVRERDYARERERRVRSGSYTTVRALPLGEVAARPLAAQISTRWFEYTYGYGSLALAAAAVAGSGVDGSTVALPQCGTRVQPYHMFQSKARPYEIESLRRFGDEIHSRTMTTIIRTAIAIGLGLPYGRDGVINSEAKVSRSYIETLMVLSGRCTDELFDRVGRPTCSLLLARYREGGREAVGDVVQTMLDWYSPRHLDNIVRMLDWYEQLILDEMTGRLRRNRASRVA